jgi:ribosome recycling factor
MVETMVAQTKPKMAAAVEHFQAELKTVRTGRASAQMVEHVLVPYYGTPTALKSLATLTVPEANQISISPFDVSAVRDIVTAIRDAGLGFNPTDDGRTVRILIPPLTSERREELVKLAHKMSEEARVSIRQVRAKTWEDIQKAKKDGVVTEDSFLWGRDELDKITGEQNKAIEEMVKQKELEIRTI